jgi:hypothetical protein
MLGSIIMLGGIIMTDCMIMTMSPIPPTEAPESR